MPYKSSGKYSENRQWAGTDNESLDILCLECGYRNGEHNDYCPPENYPHRFKKKRVYKRTIVISQKTE